MPQFRIQVVSVQASVAMTLISMSLGVSNEGQIVLRSVRKMPSILSTEDIESLSEYMGFVEQQEDIRWYRGCGDESYKLVPSLYRHPRSNEASIVLEREQRILRRFKERSLPYQERPLREDDDLSTLFLMQHYGFPTRLLDWTEKPYIGLYFALADAPYEKTDEGPCYTTDVAVWVLAPIEWNRKVFETTDSPPDIVSPFDREALNGYLPTENARRRRLHPVALYGVHNSRRIVAQRGVFTLSGSSTDPMEKIYEDHDYAQDCLMKLRVKKEHIAELLTALTEIGFTDSVVYPDLPGLAQEVKREFGFWA